MALARLDFDHIGALPIGRHNEPRLPDVAALLRYRPAWQADALCREYPEVNFFPQRGEDLGPAKQVCARCTVADECREFARANGERDGVWGGETGRNLAR